MATEKFPFHYEEKILVPATPEDLFAFLDDHHNLSSHMNKPSLMMGGGKMETILDEGKGQEIGSHIILKGKAFGMSGKTRLLGKLFGKMYSIWCVKQMIGTAKKHY